MADTILIAVGASVAGVLFLVLLYIAFAACRMRNKAKGLKSSTTKAPTGGSKKEGVCVCVCTWKEVDDACVCVCVCVIG